MLKVGIVGLPNVGKSTLFNALLKKQVALSANYPFATIEPNVGVVEVPDKRLPQLAKIVNTQKQVPAVVEFFDIAGLVEGAHKGEGLGNQFLSHIREVAVIVHVVRLFENKDITHVSDDLDPNRDTQIIESELILADLSTLDKQRRPNKKLEKQDELFYDTVNMLKGHMDQGNPARTAPLSDEQRKTIKPLNLLTLKPVLYVFNVSEEQLSKMTETEKLITTDFSRFQPALLLCAKLESEIVELSTSEQQEYLAQYNLQESGLNRLIKRAYDMLGLISFLTAGEKEVRAWTITRGTQAPQAAGVIHTDFEKKFIKAEVMPFELFVECGGWERARELGKVTLAGKEYVIQDGDVVDFKTGA